VLPVLLLVTALSPAPDLDRVRQDLLLQLNAEREHSGAPPFRLVPVLNQAAQQQAEETGRRGWGGRLSEESAAVQARLGNVGYLAYTWKESFVVSDGDLHEVVDHWRRLDRRSRELSPQLRDVGIGIAEYRGATLYALLFGWHQGDYFARETASLRDLEAVRSEMLARVNAARRSAGLAPLRRSPDLDRAAQEHAHDQLERGYFEHVSPEGSTPLSRGSAAGYRGLISENLHRRIGPLEAILEDWLRSPGHRRNLLDPGASDLGVGLAIGPGYGLDPSGYRVIWVQNFGRRSETAGLAP
jgi:uncharacterized protein YkwD